MFFITTRCSEREKKRQQLIRRMGKKSEISTNHVESCTHKCACTKRIFTRQQRHTHDTRHTTTTTETTTMRTMENGNGTFFELSVPNLSHLSQMNGAKKRRRRTRTSYAFYSNLLINNFHNHFQHVRMCIMSACTTYSSSHFSGE